MQICENLWLKDEFLHRPRIFFKTTDCTDYTDFSVRMVIRANQCKFVVKAHQWCKISFSLFSFLFFSVGPRVRIIINIIYNYYYYIKI